MFLTCNALVLREVKYKEADRILTLMTDQEGKITAKARGAFRKSSKLAAGTQQFTYSEMTLFQNKGYWTVNEANVKESFSGLTAELDKFALAGYFSECVESLSVEEQKDPPLLQLILNCLYALSTGMYSPEHIKASFEMRLMCLSGYAPDLSFCYACGSEEPRFPMLSLDKGVLFCGDCCSHTDSMVSLCPTSLAALRHICSAPARRLLSFSLEGEAQDRLFRACESYLLRQTERKFSTLDYWKKIRII